MLELVGPGTPPITPAHYLPQPAEAYDWMIGEKIWRDLFERN